MILSRRTFVLLGLSSFFLANSVFAGNTAGGGLPISKPTQGMAAAASSEVDWNAHWIWQAADGPANTWIAFRKEFELTKVPESVIANISTDTKYWLWINGEMVLFEGGLARGPHRDGTYFD